MLESNFNNSLGDALKNFWTNYFGWGRATRSEYWWPVLFYSLIPGFLLGGLGLKNLETIWLLAIMIPSFCLGARRLHDTGRSNWNLCWAFIPIIGLIILLIFWCQPGKPESNKWGAPRI